MNKKFISILIITCLALAVFVTTVISKTLYLPQTPETPLPSLIATTSDQEALNAEYPDRLLVPSINIDTVIKHVGLTAEGNMEVPDNSVDVGWYMFGPTPGQIGSANLAGHRDSSLGAAGIFRNLGNLKIGDDIFVQTKEGSRLQFVVSEIKTYPYLEAPTDLLFNRADSARLNLITCAGSFLKDARTYDQRLVVSAELQ